MEKLGHATRSKGIAANPAPSWSGGKAPSAVRKLGSNGTWNFKSSGCTLPNLEPAELPSVTVKPSASLHNVEAIADIGPEIQEPESYFRFLGETQALRDLFKESAVCGSCKRGQLEVAFTSNCVATSVHTKCSNCLTHWTSPTASTGIPQEDGRVRNSQHAANVLLVLSQILSGNGGTETGRLIGMLDLPNLSIAKTAFPLLESELSKYIIPYTEELLEKNLIEEVRLYSEKEAFDFERWVHHHDSKSSLIEKDLLPLLTIAYDMAWQKRSSGHRYDSHSGHAIPVGILTNLPIGVAVLNKHCRICSANKEDYEHDCFPILREVAEQWSQQH
jgi:hypothetical protein